MMDWLRTLRDDLRAHRQSFAISLLATVLGLGLYGYTYLAEAKTWLPQLIDSVELKTYDARFKIRGQVRSSPDIVIVAIDQKTLDDLGAWPFSRVHYARMLENLKKDGAAVVGFDISFPKPDDKSGLTLVQAARAAYLRQTPPDRRDPAYLARLEEMERQADTDAQFADSLRRAGKVVLGQLFFFNREDVTHLDEERQKAYEDVLSFGAYTQVRGLPRADGTVPPPLAETYTGLEALLPQPNLLEFADAVNYNFGYSTSSLTPTASSATPTWSSSTSRTSIPRSTSRCCASTSASPTRSSACSTTRRGWSTSSSAGCASLPTRRGGC